MNIYRLAVWTVLGLLGVLLLAFAFTAGYVANDDGGASVRAEEQRDGNQVTIDIQNEVDFATLEQIVDILQTEYFGRDNLDEQTLYEAAIRGMLDSLADTGTFYVDPTSNQLSIGPTGSFEGIGATVNQSENDIVIVQPFPGSPAERAGIRPGDVILAVDGEDAAGWTVDQAVLRIRGRAGTDVTLLVRHLDGQEEEITITRDEIQVNSVGTVPPGGALLDAQGEEVSDLAYIRISEFISTTPEEVEAAVAEAEANGASGLIIDVRGNPGGLLQETVDTADIFLDGGVVLIEIDSEDNETFYRARSGGEGVDIPVVILQDNFSASGAEVLAAALKDNGRATIIGEQSFGKGTVNIAQQLEDGGALFVTIRHWLTPAGFQIDGVGITPDVEAGPGPLSPQYDPLQDAQIQRAIEHLRSVAAAGASSGR